MTFEAKRDAHAARIEARLDEAMRDFPDNRITAGMRHALHGGKRLRGFLVLESAALHGVPAEDAVHAAAAIEALHAYSLVHDDLPCMDDDDLRRGQPTVHVKWDEATAVLVGDALQALAFEMVASGGLPAERRLDLSAALAFEAGGRGLIRGQAMDIAAETATEPFTLDEIESLQAGKTGALIEWSCAAGPLMSGADSTTMCHFARCLGLAFQIADDILDATGDEVKAGKRVGKDAAAGKATFVSHLGTDGAKDRARALVAEALHMLAPYGPEADALREAARFVISREF
ncbi:polyprenyl synthetase family protein [Silicimonas algicola]|uniref:Geranylgeranyl diphosphate synthase n=1 Tax=Silicimonas algicola TaxID=1826607 RepID=A0A316G516_9RHOB|nr:farnesyl-diphosphate synthase [Silicimonas algicola]